MSVSYSITREGVPVNLQALDHMVNARFSSVGLGSGALSDMFYSAEFIILREVLASQERGVSAEEAVDRWIGVLKDTRPEYTMFQEPMWKKIMMELVSQFEGDFWR